jgi:hypothetical protein
VENRDEFQAPVADAVRDDERRVRHDEFAASGDAARAAHFRLRLKQVDGVEDSRGH